MYPRLLLIGHASPLGHVEVVDVYHELLPSGRAEDPFPPLLHLGIHHILGHVRGCLRRKGDRKRGHRWVHDPRAKEHRNNIEQSPSYACRSRDGSSFGDAHDLEGSLALKVISRSLHGPRERLLHIPASSLLIGHTGHPQE